MFNSGFRNRRATDGQGVIATQNQYLQKTTPIPTITGWSISGSDDTALNPAGGQTVLVNGTGFATGVSATLGGSQIGAVTLVNSNQISFTSPANSGGSYTLIVYNTNSYAAILVPGLTYSTVPTWTTAAGSIGSFYETTAVSTAVVATSDSAMTYALSSGSLPVGSTLYANGVITGTAPVDSGSTTYTFAVTATDAELQDTTRTFTMTINVDVVTWVTPSSGATISLDGSAYSQALSATDAAGYAVSYTANTLPTGLTLSAGTISGTPTVEGNTSSLLTATAATTNRSATNTVTWVVSLSDTYFKYVTLGLSANASIETSSFVSDNSLNNAQLTVFGDTRAQNFNPYQTGYYSYQFVTRTDYVSLPATTLLTTFTGDFTFEAWIYPTDTSVTYWGIWDARQTGGTANAMIFALDPLDSPVTGQGRLMYYNGSYNRGTGTVYYNQWSHIAFVRAGSTMTFYINGTAGGTSTVSGTQTASATSNPIYIGSKDTGVSGAYGTVGYISNFRIVNGLAMYTANFTPSTTPLLPVPSTVLLVAQTGRFNDASIVNSTLTAAGTTKISTAVPFTTVYQASTQYYSGSFNGSSDYLSLATSPTIELTGNFTIECWIYPTSIGTYNMVLGENNGASSDYFAIRSNNTLEFLIFGGATPAWSYTWATNTWYHVAVVRISNALTAYVNGVSLTQSSGTFSTSAACFSVGLLIGRYGNSSTPYSFTGYISNVRLVKGAGIYTGNFVPSTAPLSTTQSAGTNIAAITQPSYSVLFNGSSQYLSVAANSALGLGTGDFTIEYWCYPNSISGTPTLIDFRSSAGDTVISDYLSSGAPVIYINSTNAATSSQALSAGAWAHVAYTRSGTTLRIFVNGVQTASVTNSYNMGSSQPLRIANNIAGSAYFNGYISNLRITKGQALYTSAFTPSTSPLTTTSQGATAANVSLLTCQSTTIIDNSLNLWSITNTGTATVASPNPFATGTVSLLTVQSPTFVDSSYNSLAITAATTTVKPLAQSPFTPVYYSNYFNGASSVYFSNTAQSVLAVVSGATFTVEAWVNLSSLAATRAILADNVPGNATAYWGFEITTGGYLKFWWYNGGGITCTATTTAMVVGTWYHVAVVSNAGALGLYVNGVVQSLSGTTTLGTPGGNVASIAIGQYGSPAVYMLGYISNLRITNGLAVYTGAFTPSTVPLATTQSAGTNIAAITQPSYSVYFNGSTDYLTLASSTALNLSTGTPNFTIECWVYWTGTNPAGNIVEKDGVFGSSYVSYGLDLNGSGYPRAFIGSGNGVSSQQSFVSSTVLTSRSWTHLAFVRNGSTGTLYQNGVSVATATITATMTDGSKALFIGYQSGQPSTLYFSGYISNLRITKGQALYTSAFTPTTSPLTTTSQGATATNVSLLTCQSNYIVDNSLSAATITVAGSTVVASPNPFATGSVNLLTAQSLYFIDTSISSRAITQNSAPRIAGIAPFTQPGGYSATAVTTYGSGYFDGTGDYLTIPASANLSFGTGNFTIEAWAYPTSTGSYRRIFSQYTGAGATQVFLRQNNDNALMFYVISASSVIATITSSSLLVLNTWNHCAISRNGSSFTLYLNGISVGTASSASSLPDTSALTTYISTYDGTNEPWLGYLSDLRVIKGTALYTSAFVPSFTTPLAAVTNTQLLTLQTRGAHNNSDFIDQSSFNNLVTRNGNVSNGTFDPYGNNFSTYFNGSTYFSLSNGGTLYGAIAGSLITIEFWVMTTAIQAITAFNTGIFGQAPAAAQNGRYAVQLYGTSTTSTQTVNFYYTTGTGSASSCTTTGTIAQNTWNHIAVTIDATTAATSTVKIYINGTGQTFTNQNLSTHTADPGNTFQLGAANDSNQSLTGYLSNFRFTRGQLVYTGNFTPPTAPLTALQASGTNTAAITNGSYVKALMMQSNRFIDNSAYNYSPTVATGTPQAQKFSPFATVTVPTYYSGYFDGSGDYLNIAAGNTALNLGTGDFTLECWIYATSSGTSAIVDNRNPDTANAGFDLDWLTPNKIRFSTSGTAFIDSATTVSTNTWYHLALTRSSNLFKLYINGTVDSNTYTGSSTQNFTNTNFRIGSGQNGAFSGYISNLRITKGQVLYTTNFTPSTTPLTTTSQSATAANVSLLTCQSNTFVDNSTNYFAITANGDAKPLAVSPFTPTASSAVSYTPTSFSGSMYFDGSSDYLTVTNSIFTTTGDFTVECWAYVLSAQSGNYGGLFSTRDSSNSAGISINLLNTGYLDFGAYPGGGYTSTLAPLNQWFHVAMTRSGSGSNNVKCFLNGAQVGTISGTATTSTNSGLAIIGRYYVNGANQYFLSGYISDLRYTVGTALYTANFYPGAAPATPTYTIGTTTYSSNLLLSGDSGGVIDYSRTVDLETVADARVTQFSPYAGSYYSNYFSSSSYLSTSKAGGWLTSGSNFTVEAWAYLTAYAGSSSGNYASSIMATASGSTGWDLSFWGTATSFTSVTYYHKGANISATYTGTISLGTWYHVAAVRSGTTVTVYVNGVAGATTATLSTWTENTGLLIAADGVSGYPYYLNGYISNLRIVNGQALYTTNFTPSTTPLTTTSQGATAGNVSLLTCQSNKFVDNSSNAFALTTSGTPKVQTQNPFALNSGISYYFDGTGDYLSIASTPTNNFGAGNFTIEFWINPTTWYGSVYEIGGASKYLVIYRNNSSSTTKMGVRFNDNAGSDFFSTADVPTNQWSFWALVRNNGTLTWYFNGTASGTASYATSIPGGTATVGYSVGFNIIYTGYVTDLRVTNGYARYTSAFTPPTTPYKTN